MEERPWSRIALALALVCVIMAIGMAYLYFQPSVPLRPTAVSFIGVIDIEGTIVESDATNLISAAIDEALNDPQVKGVVLRIDSPGGSAHLIEQVYLDVLRLKESKPTVASLTLALSGGYYIAVGADTLYTSPTSMVGNVGVIGSPPGVLIPSEGTYETGPEKVTGFKVSLFAFNLSHALDNFALAVEAGRGDRLEVPPLKLRRGTVFLGSEALEKGLVDELGSLQDAVDRVAEEAGIEKFTLRNMIKEALEADDSSYYVEERGQGGLTMETLNRLNPPPAIYYLYLPGRSYTQSEGELPDLFPDENVTETYQDFGQVVVDLSHGNRMVPWVLDLLSAELAMRGVFMGYTSDWGVVEATLNYTSCLIIAAPTEYYTFEEYRAIRDFVREGGMLLLFYDPAEEFNEVLALMGPVNSIANHYGLSYGKGYLYNMEDHHGFYRNIYVRDFEDTNLTQGLETLVFFTSTYLHPTDTDAAYVSPGTYSSTSERSIQYAPIAVLEKNNGTVAAFADITWLMEPYVYTEDNHQLLMNLVDMIVDVSEEMENGE